MDENNDRLEILIVGGGLVGALNSLFFAQHNRFNVTICEKSADNGDNGRSINLSLSERGLEALKIMGLEEEILQKSTPMYARMVHERNGRLKRFFYGKSSQCLFAIERKVLLDILLTKVKFNNNINIKYNTNLVDVNFKENIAKFKNLKEKENIEIKFDLLVGNDGAYSQVRYIMSKNLRMDFSQEYIMHGYVELRFPATKGNEFSIDQKCLHIWPRNEYMLTALPNLDGSFTGTLFMPFKMFEDIKTKDDLIKLFETDFPDALEIIGISHLQDRFDMWKPSKMITIRCNPYNLDEKCVIMGDAAHAMVPFYGQGMNCGFEDVMIFHELLMLNDFDLGKTCSDFSENRNNDAKAICELASYNYLELRKNITSFTFRLRKMLDYSINLIFPSYWIPLYTMVCFTRIPYRKCVEEKKKQDKILSTLGKLGIGCILSSILISANRILRNIN